MNKVMMIIVFVVICGSLNVAALASLAAGRTSKKLTSLASLLLASLQVMLELP